MESAGLMQHLAYNQVELDGNTLKKLEGIYNDYMLMNDDELLKNNENVVNFISANCFNLRPPAQKLLERLCELNAEFYSHKLHLLYFSLVVNSKLIFDKFIEMADIDITEEIVTFAYNNKYMIDRLLRRTEKLGDYSKGDMWKKFLFGLDSCYKTDEQNCKDLYDLYRGVWKCEIDFISLLQIDDINNFCITLEKLDNDIDLSQWLLANFKVLFRNGDIRNIGLCIDHFKLLLTPEIVNALMDHLKKTIEYVKHKFRNQIICVMDEKSSVKPDDNNIQTNDEYETVYDGCHVFDLFSVLEDNEQFEDNIVNDAECINYEGCESKFATLLYDFDKYINDEFNTYFLVKNKLETLLMAHTDDIV
jgi:hypothetical protein